MSALVLGSIAIEITGSGKSSDSSSTGAFTAASVSPVTTSRRPTTAAMSPARTSSRSWRLFACICSSRPIRLLRPLATFSTASPALATPE